MKKFTLVAVLSLGLLTACAPKEEEVKVEENTIQTTVSVVADGKEVAEKVLVIPEGETLQETMVENFDVVEADGFITTIEGVEQDAAENKFWVFEVDEAQVNEGAETFIPEEDDSIVWELMAF